jgi:hypothetical protein
VLRATDELDADAAKLFEQLQQYRIKDTLTIPIMSELNFADKLLLVSAGLLVDPGFSGHVSQLIEGEDNTGEKLWMYTFGKVYRLPLGTKHLLKTSRGLLLYPSTF